MKSTLIPRYSRLIQPELGRKIYSKPSLGVSHEEDDKGDSEEGSDLEESTCLIDAVDSVGLNNG